MMIKIELLILKLSNVMEEKTKTMKKKNAKTVKKLCII